MIGIMRSVVVTALLAFCCIGVRLEGESKQGGCHGVFCWW